MEIGDIVSVKASQCEASYSTASWFVSNSAGLLVLHPDTLISSTAVVGSHFCGRRGVLSEWFRGIDGDSRIMVIGSLVHELLQEVILFPLPFIYPFYSVLCCMSRFFFNSVYAHKYVSKLNEWQFIILAILSAHYLKKISSWM